MHIKKWLRVVALIVSTISLTVTVYAQNEVTPGETTTYYESKLVTENLGRYEFLVSAKERPSHEVLPIVSDSYFPNSTLELTTLVDNTVPSARYDAMNKTKVDIVFAFGETKYSSQLQDYTKTYESLLNQSGSYADLIDANVETVETSTVQVDDSSASLIMNTWEARMTYRGGPSWEPDIASSSWQISGNKLLSLHGPDNYTYYYSLMNPDYNINGDFEMKFTFGLDATASDFGHGESGFFIAIDRNRTSGYGIMIDNHDACGNLMYNGYAILFNYESGRYTALETVDVGMYAAGARYSFTVSVKNNVASVTYSSTRNGASGSFDPIDISSTGSDRTYGFYTYRQANAYFDDIQVTTGSTKSLGEAISDVQWRDGSYHIVIHATDVLPQEFTPEGMADGSYDYTVQKLLASNCYLLNLGTNTNQYQLKQLVNSITTPDTPSRNGLRGDFWNTQTGGSLDTIMRDTAAYVAYLAEQNAQVTNYLLVNQGVVWETTYEDYEKDVPLNWGAHIGTNGEDKADIEFAQENNKLTPTKNYFTGESTEAERWRFTHYQTHYDNNLGKANFSDTWIDDHVNSFSQTGKYFVNYKRKDNPLTSFNLNDAFNEFRYWSNNYDPISEENSIEFNLI